VKIRQSSLPVISYAPRHSRHSRNSSAGARAVRSVLIVAMSFVAFGLIAALTTFHGGAAIHTAAQAGTLSVAGSNTSGAIIMPWMW
jgi:hypothetical protein